MQRTFHAYPISILFAVRFVLYHFFIILKFKVKNSVFVNRTPAKGLTCKTSWFYDRGNSIIFTVLNYHRDRIAGRTWRACAARLRPRSPYELLKTFIVASAKNIVKLPAISIPKIGGLYCRLSGRLYGSLCLVSHVYWFIKGWLIDMSYLTKL